MLGCGGAASAGGALDGVPVPRTRPHVVLWQWCAAGDHDHLTGDVAGLLGRQKDVRRCQLRWLGGALHRRLLAKLRRLLRRHGGGDQRRPHWPGRHDVDTHALLDRLLRQARCTICWQCTSSPMSPGTATPCRPAARTTRSVSWASGSSSGKYEMSTSAPSRVNASATARPMPLSPPVWMRRHVPSARHRRSGTRSSSWGTHAAACAIELP